MTIPDEIIKLVKVRLVKGIPKVNIANDLNISLWTMQSSCSGRSDFQCANKSRQRISKAELQIKQAVCIISKGGQCVNAKKVCDSLTLQTSHTTGRRRLQSMG